MTADVNEVTVSPQLAPIPQGASLRLLDSGMLHYEASLAGFAERYSRGETSHTIHVWWARRPHSAMRALVFAALSKDTSAEAYDLLKRLSVNPTHDTLSTVRMMLKAQYNGQPRVLDMFGGGGTIPLESSNIGAKTYSIDSNQLSVFIQKCNLVYSQGIDKTNVITILKAAGTRVLNNLTTYTEPLFPLRSDGLQSPFAYLWTYSMKCPNCGFKFYLSKRPWLSKKKGKKIALEFKNSNDGQEVTINFHANVDSHESVWVGRGGNIECPSCKEKHSDIDIQKCQDEMVALVRSASGTGKEFISTCERAVPSMDIIQHLEHALLKELDTDLPDSTLPVWSGIVNPAIYGIRTHSDFLNRRQRVVLLCLIKALKEEYQQLLTEHTKETAQYVLSLLSSMVDQLVDWNSRLSMWISQNEQVGRAFSGPGVAMLWDYVEIDPVLTGPANLWSKLNRIINGAKAIPIFNGTNIDVKLAHAQALPYDDDFFDAIVTDPPYYDNIYYTVLADFFFAWKRILLKDIDPTLFNSMATDKSYELVASKFRSQTAQKAHEDYCVQFTLAIREAERVLKKDGIFSLVYSHSSIQGWEAFVRAYRATNLRITSVQPLSIERKQRPRAMTSQAVNTCIVFTARKSDEIRSCMTLNEVCSTITNICDSFAESLLKSGWNDEDTALAVFGNGVGLLCNVQDVTDTNGIVNSLLFIESIVRDKFPAFNLKKRQSL